MVIQQRWAVFRIAVALSALGLFLLVVPRMGLMRAQAAFGVLGFLGIAPLVFRKRAGEIAGDERDRMIHLRAIQIGTGLFWLLFAGGLWTAYFHFMNDRVVPVAAISLLAWLTWTTFELCNAAAMLFLYRRS